MRTKRTIGYSILILIIGIFLGWAIFGSSNHNGHAHEEGVNEAQIWTCSMDPQVRQNEPGKCPLCGMDLIPLKIWIQAEVPIRLLWARTLLGWLYINHNNRIS